MPVPNGTIDFLKQLFPAPLPPPIDLPHLLPQAARDSISEAIAKACETAYFMGVKDGFLFGVLVMTLLILSHLAAKKTEAHKPASG